MQDGPKAVWSMLYISVIFFPSLKKNYFAYRSSKVSSCPYCMSFEIHQQWQSGFSRVYSNCCCSCSFEPEIIKIGQSSDKMYSNNIVNFQESTTIVNACTKKSGNLLNVPCISANINLCFLFFFSSLSAFVLIYLFLSLSLSLSLSLFLSFFLTHSLSLFLSFFLHTYITICLYLYQSIPIYLSICIHMSFERKIHVT